MGTGADASSGTAREGEFTRRALVDHPILDVLAERWSPRAFDPDAVVPETALRSVLEAARWAPSSSNSQPWRFAILRRGSVGHVAAVKALHGRNGLWAPRAGALVVALVDTEFDVGRERGTSSYDVGQAVAHLTMQAHAEGLHTHQMAGFDPDAVRRALAIDERFTALTIIAIGAICDPDTLPEELLRRETAPRRRRSVDESVLFDE